MDLELFTASVTVHICLIFKILTTDGIANGVHSVVDGEALKTDFTQVADNP